MNAMRAADRGRGVLRLYGNYGGDKMNFDLAGEMLEDEGLTSTTVLGIDDIASAPPEKAVKRRGVAGIVFSFKVAGAAAEAGADLDEVTRLAQLSVDRSRTIGLAMSSCQLPGAAAPTFELADGEVEMGMGIHGEPGFSRSTLRSADEVADEMLAALLAEKPADADGRVAVMLNSLGSTSLEELYILYRRVSAQLSRQGFEIVFPLVGRYVTSLEMGGASLSLMHLDDDLLAQLKAPATCPFWTVS
jgi:dihydroxyacetone kinase-like protein